MHGLQTVPYARRSTDSASVAGVKINLPTPGTAAGEVIRRASRGESFTLFTLNLDHVVKLKSSTAFRAIYQRAQLVTADGWPVVWLAKRQGATSERTTGADMVEPLCAAAAAQGLGVYFVGPGPEAQAGALNVLRRRYKGLRIAGAETPRVPASDGADPLAKFDIDALARRINASDARLCFVSLGAPKQEFVADALAARCPHVGFLCVGAALDFISGDVARAPVWMQRTGLEWFWRMANNPGRFGARYAYCAAIFFNMAMAAVLKPRPQKRAPAPGLGRRASDVGGPRRPAGARPTFGEARASTGAYQGPATATAPSRPLASIN